MPEIPLFLDTFNLAEGKVFGNYKLTHIDIAHISEVRWNEYSYPMTLTFIWQNKDKPNKDNVSNMISIFTQHVSKVREAIVPSGRSYKCTFIWPIGSEIKVNKVNDNSEINLTCTGYAKRISKDEAKRVKKSGQW